MTAKSKTIKSLDQSQRARKTNLEEWLGKQFEETDLPSGLHVILRDVDVEDIASTGQIPNYFIEIFKEIKDLEQEEAAKKFMDEHPGEFRILLDKVAEASLVEPRVGPISGIIDGIPTISLYDLRGKDKIFMLNHSVREVTKIKPFREGKDESIEVARDGGGLRDEAELNHRNKE